MRCMIIDDNPIARAVLAQFASQVTGLMVVFECCNAIDAYNYLQNNAVDVLLLDIEMPDMTGLELTRNLKNKDIIIIFTTSKKQYAVEAFELNVADYLVKPVTAPRFIQAIDRARTILDGKKDLGAEFFEDEFIFVRDTNIIKKLKLSDILYAEAMGDYVKFHTPQKVYAIHVTFKTAEEKLPVSQFIRVHRSYIISIARIDSLQDGGVVIGDRFIPVTDGYRKALSKRIKVI